jgi:hypothetical protein
MSTAKRARHLFFQHAYDQILTDDAAAHPAAMHERQPAEHFPFRHAGPAAEHAPDAGS